MRIDDLKKRLQKDRPVTTFSLKLPDDVIGDLQRLAPRLGFSNYQALARAYIGQGLRTDLEREASHVRGHSAFSNSYSAEDEGLYDEQEQKN